MMSSLRKILLGAGFAGVALLSLSAAAFSGGHGGMDHDPARMIAHMADRLGLSAEQQDQVEQIAEDSRERMAPYHEELKELREQLHAMRDDFDPDTARSVANRIGEITAELVYEMASTQAEIHDLLTPEQRERMESLMEQRSERRSKWHQRHGWGSDEE